MNKPAISVMAAILIVISVMSARSQTSDDEAYRVYDSVIAEMFAGNKVTFDTRAPVKLLVINDTTTIYYASSEKKENWERVKQRLPKLTNSLIQIYESRLNPATKLERRFELGLQYVLVDHSELDEYRNQEQEWWTSFYTKYPDSGGFITFSNVAFNDSGDQALVYFIHWCGPVCGTGHYLLMGKTESGWSVIERAEMWIS